MPVKNKFNKKELEYYRKRLLEVKREIIGEMIEKDSELADMAEGVGDLADLAYESSLRDHLYTLSSKKTEILEAIEDAFYKIEKGTYGRCEKCGTMIKTGRLKAIPYARLCLKDQEEEDRRAL